MPLDQLPADEYRPRYNVALTDPHWIVPSFQVADAPQPFGRFFPLDRHPVQQRTNALYRGFELTHDLRVGVQQVSLFVSIRVDLEQPEPVNAAMDRFEELVDELEQVV